jgi:5-methylcytosine-specific restriction endonuclease McrBC GTP-binding regulatory subunit McrB
MAIAPLRTRKNIIFCPQESANNNLPTANPSACGHIGKHAFFRHQGAIVDQQSQKEKFIEWYKKQSTHPSKGESEYTKLIGRIKLRPKDNQLLSIKSFDELNKAIKEGGLEEWFSNKQPDKKRGRYKENLEKVFNISGEEGTHKNASGIIKNYLEFLKSTANTSIMKKNLILCGPPGTGKTYSTVQYAVAIIEGKFIEDIKGKKYQDVYDLYQKYKKAGQIAFTTFHQSFGYEEFIEGIAPDIGLGNKGNKGNTQDAGQLAEGTEAAKEEKPAQDVKYILRDGIFKRFCEEAKKDPGPPYVFIIDEINRGNISKIFGELITLIEDSKRIGKDEELLAMLPYSQQEFGVPDNVYLIGTMNTADRSIAMLDIALRRRFSFVEMMPDSSVLKDIKIEGLDINIADMLEILNQRIAALLDCDHLIGHTFFLPLEKDPSLARLGRIFKGEIIPLLQEYFFNDYEKIRLVLGDNQKEKEGKPQFVTEIKTQANKLFGETDSNIEVAEVRYEINGEAFEKAESYAFLK